MTRHEAFDATTAAVCRSQSSLKSTLHSVDVDSQALYATHVRTQRTADFSSERSVRLYHTLTVHVRFLPFFAFAFPFWFLLHAWQGHPWRMIEWTDSESSGDLVASFRSS